jgi:hypothetical protein
MIAASVKECQGNHFRVVNPKGQDSAGDRPVSDAIRLCLKSQNAVIAVGISLMRQRGVISDFGAGLQSSASPLQGYALP